MSHQVLPRPGEYVTVEEKNETSVLSLPSHIAHSGRTIATMLNTCQEPDFFSSVGGLGPAPATGGIDDACLIRAKREFIEMCYRLLGMKAIGCVYDISHVQWQQLNSSAQLRRSTSRTQILAADTIAEHLNTVLGVHDMACFKYGWSCCNDSNFDDGHMGLWARARSASSSRSTRRRCATCCTRATARRRLRT